VAILRTPVGIHDKSISERKLDDGSVSSRVIQAGAVTGDKIAPGVIPPPYEPPPPSVPGEDQVVSPVEGPVASDAESVLVGPAVITTNQHSQMVHVTVTLLMQVTVPGLVSFFARLEHGEAYWIVDSQIYEYNVLQEDVPVAFSFTCLLESSSEIGVQEVSVYWFCDYGMDAFIPANGHAAVVAVPV
jgi:hypothetical protein